MRKAILTSKNLTELPFAEPLTSLPEASLANRFPSQEIEKAMQMTELSGTRCLESFAKLNLGSLWQKTFLVSLVSKGAWYSNKCVLTWKIKATPYKRLLFQLAPKMRPISETEFGLLPTIIAGDAINRSPLVEAAIMTKNKTIRRSNANGTQSNMGLSATIAYHLLPTLKAQDHKHALTDRNRSNCGEVVIGQIGLKLQPNFAEWMVGYPLNWTQLDEETETPE